MGAPLQASKGSLGRGSYLCRSPASPGSAACAANPRGCVLTLPGVSQGTLTTSTDTGNSRARTAPAPRSTPATSPTTSTTSAVLSSTAWTRSCSRTTSRGRCEHHLLSLSERWVVGSVQPIPWEGLEPRRADSLPRHQHVWAPQACSPQCVCGLFLWGCPEGWWLGASSHWHVVHTENITSAWTTWSETSSCAARWTRMASCPSR